MTDPSKNEDPHLPASESGTGIIPEEGGGPAGETRRPASEADTAPLQEDGAGGEPQSWPGKSFGTILPPG